MMTVIIPVDFSESSFNAARYAASMFASKPETNLILYHYYASDDDLPTARNFIESLKQELSVSGLPIETFLEPGDNFIDRFSAFAHVRRAYLIVMGLTGKTSLAQRFSGTNTLKMTEKNICPVLIVPQHAQYTGIHNALITSEMKYVDETPVLMAVKRVLKDFKPALHILNVDSSHYISLTEDFKAERDKMQVLLQEFNPEFYFMRLFDFHESVNLFTKDKNIDMIIIGPRQHGFFDRLFKTQHTKQLLYQSEVPVLTVHE